MLHGKWWREDEDVSVKWLRSFHKGVMIEQKRDVSNLDDFEEACSR